MDITIAHVVAAVGTASGVVALLTVAVRLGRVLEQVDGLRKGLEECVQTSRWVDQMAHITDRLSAIVAKLDGMDERLRASEIRAAAHPPPTWPPDR